MDPSGGLKQPWSNDLAAYGRGFDSHRPLQFVQDKASNQSQLLPTIAGFLVAHETTFHFMPLAIAGSG